MATIHWRKAELAAKNLAVIQDAHERVPAKPGVYIFSRKHSDDGDYEPFYVGIATISLRNRLCQYLNNDSDHEKRIRNVLEGGLDRTSGIRINNGRRYFHAGILIPIHGQQAEPTLRRAERALTHAFVIQGWQLINVQNNREPEFDMTGSIYNGLLSRTLLSPRR